MSCCCIICVADRTQFDAQVPAAMSRDSYRRRPTDGCRSAGVLVRLCRDAVHGSNNLPERKGSRVKNKKKIDLFLANRR